MGRDLSFGKDAGSFFIGMGFFWIWPALERFFFCLSAHRMVAVQTSKGRTAECITDGMIRYI